MSPRVLRDRGERSNATWQTRRRGGSIGPIGGGSVQGVSIMFILFFDFRLSRIS